MEHPDGRPIQSNEPAPLVHAIDDRLREIIIVEHGTPVVR
jgi:hypothetical protein